MQTDWEETQMKLLTTATIALALAVTAQAASASCDAGEMVIKFSHVTNTDKHPKGIAASLLQEREEVNPPFRNFGIHRNFLCKHNFLYSRNEQYALPFDISNDDIFWFNSI